MSLIGGSQLAFSTIRCEEWRGGYARATLADTYVQLFAIDDLDVMSP